MKLARHGVHPEVENQVDEVPRSGTYSKFGDEVIQLSASGDSPNVWEPQPWTDLAICDVPTGSNSRSYLSSRA